MQRTFEPCTVCVNFPDLGSDTIAYSCILVSWTKMLFLHFEKLFICLTSTEDTIGSKWEKEISIATYLWQKHPASEMQRQTLRV